MRGWTLRGALGIASGLAACTADPLEPLCLSESCLVVARDGTIDLLDGAQRPVLRHAYAAVELDALYGQGVQLRTDEPGKRSVRYWDDEGPLGPTRWVEIVVQQLGQPDLRWTIGASPDFEAWTFALAVDNHTEGDVQVAKMAPLRLRGREGGGLWLGADPARHRILENGSFTALDFVALVQPGDLGPQGYATIAPGDFAGHSVSNWNHAVIDLDSEAVWVAGALTFEASMPVVNLSYLQSESVLADGRQGFSYLSAESAYLPAPKNVAAGASFDSEVFAVLPSEPDAQRGLEHYAEAVAAWLDIVPWHRRVPGRRVPNGWNSWTTSGGTGGYGTDIDEGIILANLDLMATELRDWGFDWFQVDDGYQPHFGDWWFDPETFPHGGAWLAQQIRDRGMRPGLWMAPFTLSRESATAQAHPDWLAHKTLLGSVLAPDREILDLTHPEAQAWLVDLFHTFRQEWGFEWLKLDFGYYALFGDQLYDPSQTREEAWLSAVRLIDEALGDESFFLLIGSLGLDYGVADGGRLTLDNMPVWDGLPGLDLEDRLQQQGLKPTVRTAGRRWYLQDRVWVNHPDLVVFRSNTEQPSWPRLTFEQSRAFAAFVGLSGGIVKIGDRLVDLDAASLDVLRRLVPILGHPARPVDLFEREFPEVWHLQVTPLDGFDESYHVLGLFHWGDNLDLTTWPYAPVPDDGPRDKRVDLDALGLPGAWLAYEFWEQAFLGVVEGELSVAVPSGDSRVVALRPVLGHPQFLGWNRQITMGGTVLQQCVWADDALTLRFEVVPGTDRAPFTWDLAFYVPDGFGQPEVRMTGAAVGEVQTTHDGLITRVRFDAQQKGELNLVLAF